MRRISTATKVADKFGAGKDGFTDGNAVTGISATDLEAVWFDHVQEEIAGVIEATGVALDPANRSQLLTALRQFSPAGKVSYFGMSAAPAGWLKANGALVSRATYAALFTAIGTTFGAGDGVTTFALPDLRGEFLRGYDDSRGVDSGRVFGSAQGDLFKAHTHGMDGRADITAAGSTIMPYTGGGGAILTTSTGGAETRPRNIALLACIKY